jgi:hypothetical protein
MSKENKGKIKYSYIIAIIISLIIGYVIGYSVKPETEIITITLSPKVKIVSTTIVIPTTIYTAMPTIYTKTPTPDTSALDAILNKINVTMSKLYEPGHNFSIDYRITYEMEELLGKALEEYSAIAEKLPPDMSYGYKIRLTLVDTDIKRERAYAEVGILGDILFQAYDDPKILPQLELALTSFNNLIYNHHQILDTLQRLYEQDPGTSEKWGLTPDYIADYQKFVTTSEDFLDLFRKDYENIMTYYKEYTPIKQKNIKASSEIQDRLMALGIIPSDLASFFDQFDEDGNGEISLGEGEKFFYWVEKNIKYRYDDENSKEGFQRLRAGWITQEQLGDGRPGSNYWQKPYETFKEGYGDCEDMGILETAFYNYFGIEAYVAMVSVKQHGIIDHALCIVKIGDNLDEFTKYLGRLNYYKLNGKYFMMVDNAYSDNYGYISGGTIGVDVDFTLIEYYALEQASAKWWA